MRRIPLVARQEQMRRVYAERRLDPALQAKFEAALERSRRRRGMEPNTEAAASGAEPEQPRESGAVVLDTMGRELFERQKGYYKALSLLTDRQLAEMLTEQVWEQVESISDEASLLLQAIRRLERSREGRL